MKKTLPIILATIALGLAVLGFFVLPDEVCLKLAFNGTATNSVPKAIGVALPLIISAIGIIMMACDADRKKSWVLTTVGYAAAIFTMVINFM